jgi:phosphoenolpyruvate---glycerone phosphotransferase subunit DhaL
MDQMTTADAIALLARLKALFEARREELIALDGQVGDSDLGLTMSKGFAAAADAVVGSQDPVGKLFMRAGMAIAKAAPSTMGTLMATGFMRGGKALEGAALLGTAEALRFWEAFTNGIAERGKAKPGDKTVLDALLPAVEALRTAAASGEALGPAMAAAAKAAAAGLEATKGMVAQHGKAACFGEKTRGLPDAGATVGCQVVETMAQVAGGG